MTVDGTDFLIKEPQPFNKMWFGHKYNHAALRYEVAISIFSGEIVWVNGPFPAGEFTDQKIVGLTDGLEAHMLPYETYLADGIYRHCLRSIVAPFTSKLRARHENANGMFKEFRCLRDMFRHDINKHSIVAFAVFNIIALRIKHQTPLNENVDVSVVGVLPGPP
jgi:hypothetical protein